MTSEILANCLTEDERQKILKDAGYNEEQEFIPYRDAILKRKKAV